MKKIIGMFVMAAAAITLTGCFKSDTCNAKEPSTELAAMRNYATTKGYTMVEDASGLMYQIVEEGTGATPGPNSTLSVEYVGRFITNDQIFDQSATEPVTFSLYGVIQAWQIAMPKIKKGGTIRIISPSKLAYGCQPYYTIPANSVLFFEVKLKDVQ